MRISARRLALFVLAAAVLDVIVTQVMWYVSSSRDSGLVFGYNGSMLYSYLSLLWPILLLDAGVLALRRRPATKPELIILIVLGGLLVLVGLVASSEPLLAWTGMYGELAVLVIAAFSWVPIGLAAVATLVVITVATIRGPRPGAESEAGQRGAPLTTS